MSKPQPSIIDRVKLADVVFPGETRDPRSTGKKSFSYVDIASVSNRTFSIESPKIIAGEDAPSRARKVIKTGDVLYATTRPYLKSIAPVPGSLDNQICSTGFCVLRPTERILPEWLFYCATSEEVLSQITPLMRGATYPAVTDKDILGAVIPLPPISEQRRIVARINECMERVEAIKELRAKSRLEAAALYKARAFDLLASRVAESPKEKFESLVTTTRLGLVRSRSEQSESNPIAYLRMQDLPGNGRINLNGLARVNASKNEINLNSLMVGDFLFNTRNSVELVGKTAVVESLNEVTLFNNNLMRIRFSEGVDPRYINHIFQHEIIKSQLDLSKNKTTSVCAIYWKNLAKVLVPLPPLQIQRELADNLDTSLFQKEAIIAGINDSNASISCLRDAILRKAFAGEL